MSSHNVKPALFDAAVERAYADLLKDVAPLLVDANHRVIHLIFGYDANPADLSSRPAETYRMSSGFGPIKIVFPVPTGIVEFEIAPIVKSFIRDGFKFVRVIRG